MSVVSETSGDGPGLASGTAIRSVRRSSGAADGGSWSCTCIRPSDAPGPAPAPGGGGRVGRRRGFPVPRLRAGGGVAPRAVPRCGAAPRPPADLPRLDLATAPCRTSTPWRARGTGVGCRRRPGRARELFAASRRAMDDMPMDERGATPRAWDVDRLHAVAAAVADRGDHLDTVAAVTEADGTVVGLHRGGGAGGRDRRRPCTTGPVSCPSTGGAACRLLVEGRGRPSGPGGLPRAGRAGGRQPLTATSRCAGSTSGWVRAHAPFAGVPAELPVRSGSRRRPSRRARTSWSRAPRRHTGRAAGVRRTRC